MWLVGPTSSNNSTQMYRDELHATISAEVERLQLSGDDAQTFWLAALEAAADADRPFLEAGREAVQKHRNREITHRWRFVSVGVCDVVVAPDGRYALQQWELAQHEPEPDECEAEPDTAAQHETLEQLITQLPTADQRLIADMRVGRSQTDIAADLGVSQSAVWQRMRGVEAKLRALRSLAENPIDRSELADLPAAQRKNAEALLDGETVASPRAVRRIVENPRVSESTREHLRIRLQFCARLSEPKAKKPKARSAKSTYKNS